MVQIRGDLIMTLLRMVDNSSSSGADNCLRPATLLKKDSRTGVSL